MSGHRPFSAMTENGRWAVRFLRVIAHLRRTAPFAAATVEGHGVQAGG